MENVNSNKEVKKISKVALDQIKKYFRAGERSYATLAKLEEKKAKIEAEIAEQKDAIYAIELPVRTITKKYSPDGKEYTSADLFEWVTVPCVDDNGNTIYKEDGTIKTRKTIAQKYDTIFPPITNELSEYEENNKASEDEDPMPEEFVNQLGEEYADNAE